MKAELRLVGGRLHVRTPYAPALIARFKSFPGYRFHGDTKEWSFPAARDVVTMVCDACGVLPWMLPGPLREALGRSPHEAFQRVALDMGVLDGYVFKTEPFEHQRRNLARLAQNPVWLLADEMGTGKSKAVCDRLRLWQSRSPNRLRALIVCPKSVLGTWEQQLPLHAGMVCQVTGPRLDPWLREPAEVLAVSYEYLRGHLDTFLAQEFHVLILDEIHRVKSFTAAVSKAVRRVAAKAQLRYGLSGTPAPNGMQDWFGVLTALDPAILKDDLGNVIDTKTAFEARYCVKQRVGEGEDGRPNGPARIVGYRNVEELHAVIASVCSRVTKAECLDLPEKVYSSRSVRLLGEQDRVYRELKRDAVARLKPLWDRAKHAIDVAQQLAVNRACSAKAAVDYMDETHTLTVNNVLAESLRLLQVVGGFVPDDDGNLHELQDKAKAEALWDLIDEAGDKQVVVWCAFQAEVYWLAEQLAGRYKATVSTLTGRINSGTVRQEMVERFAAGHARFFVGTAAAGGLGINGLQAADTEVYYSRDWNLATYLQSQDRLHRIGQKNSVSVVKLIAQGTVDQKVEDALERKASLQEMLLTDPEDLF